MPRFVILRHDCPPGYQRPTHWDFMLDSGDALRTWALAEEPVANREIAAEQLADHRREYLTYEGPISGGRGSVARWDAGEYEIIRERAGEEMVVTLAGTRLHGELTLRKLDSSPQRWGCWLKLA